MADTIFNDFVYQVGTGTIDLDSHTFKIALVTSSYTIDATDTQWSEISGAEVANGNGYTTGGKTLTVTWTRTGGVAKFDADDVSWTTSSFTARYAVIYDDTAANKDVVCLFDFTENKTVSNGTFAIAFHSSGIITI